MVEALVAQRDARVVPVLVRILEESDPFGTDHAIVVETLGALTVGSDKAVPALVRLDAEKEAARREEEPGAQGALAGCAPRDQKPRRRPGLEDAAKTGDRCCKKLAQAGG